MYLYFWSRKLIDSGFLAFQSTSGRSSFIFSPKRSTKTIQMSEKKLCIPTYFSNHEIFSRVGQSFKFINFCYIAIIFHILWYHSKLRIKVNSKTSVEWHIWGTSFNVYFTNSNSFILGISFAIGFDKVSTSDN